MTRATRPRRWCKGRVTKMFKKFLAEEANELEIVKVAPKGNCLWESCEKCGVGNGISWREIKKATTDHMLAKREQYEPFCDDTETLDQRIYKIRKANAWAGQLEMRAMSELYSVSFSLYQIEDRRVQVSQMSFCEEEPTHRVRVTYDGCHYNPILKKKPGSKRSAGYKQKKKKESDKKKGGKAKKPESWSIRLRFRKRQQPIRAAKRKLENTENSDDKVRKRKKRSRVSQIQRYVKKKKEIFYFIEKILEERILPNSSGKEYLVKWKNYPESAATWEPESAVSHSDAFKFWKNQEEEYAIEKVLDERKIENGTEYFIKWENYPESEATWEPHSAVSHLDAFVYWKNREEEYTIEKILDERKNKNETEYLIKWENYPASEVSWEPHSGVSHSDPFQEWIKKNSLKKRRLHKGSHAVGEPRKGAKWGYIGVSKFSKGFRGITKLKKGGVKTTTYYNTALEAARARENWMKNNSRLILPSCLFNWG